MKSTKSREALQPRSRRFQQTPARSITLVGWSEFPTSTCIVCFALRRSDGNVNTTQYSLLLEPFERLPNLPVKKTILRMHAKWRRRPAVSCRHGLGSIVARNRDGGPQL